MVSSYATNFKLHPKRVISRCVIPYEMYIILMENILHVKTFKTVRVR